MWGGDDACAHRARFPPFSAVAAGAAMAEDQGPLLTKARRVVAQTMEHEFAQMLFNEPVDPDALGLPDYFDVVKVCAFNRPLPPLPPSGSAPPNCHHPSSPPHPCPPPPPPPTPPPQEPMDLGTVYSRLDKKKKKFCFYKVPPAISSALRSA